MTVTAPAVQPKHIRRVQTAVRSSGETVLALPPIESGDRLPLREFERRYQAMPWVKKAELIEGVVYMPSPVRFRSHSKPHAQVLGWLAAYCVVTEGVEMGDNATIRLDADNEVQPDALLRLVDGQSQVSDDDYVEGAPELIVEIAGSSAAIDLHDKKNVYRRNGVKEYIVWQIFDQRLDWFILGEEGYSTLQPDEAGVIHSQIFPGLRLAVSALLEGDLAKVLAALQQNIEQAGKGV